MQLHDWKNFLYPYEQTVNELVLKFESLSEEYRRLGLYSPIESVSGRVKKAAGIIEKAKKKNLSLQEIDHKIEDIAGLRILCKFVEDIPKILNLIRQRDGADIEILEERDYVTNTKPSGYRSYHVIIYYLLHSVQGIKKIKAEIQIRTLAMNFWATNEHSLKYKYSGNVPEELRARLIACAEAAYQLDTEMSTIRNEIMNAEKNNQIKNELVNDILENIKNLYYIVKIEEINTINKEFLDLWEDGDIEKLKNFHVKLSSITDKVNKI